MLEVIKSGNNEIVHLKLFQQAAAMLPGTCGNETSVSNSQHLLK